MKTQNRDNRLKNRINHPLRSCILFIIIILLFQTSIYIGCSPSSSDFKLDATVYYGDRGGLTIINNNDFPWSNVKLILNYNGDNLSSGYIYEYGDGIGVIRSTFIESWNFYNSDGDQFKYWEEDPVNLLIQAENALNGQKGTYLKTW